MYTEEIGDFSEYEDFYDYHYHRWWMIETHGRLFGVNSRIFDLFQFAYACGYEIKIEFRPKI